MGHLNKTKKLSDNLTIKYRTGRKPNRVQREKLAQAVAYAREHATTARAIVEKWKKGQFADFCQAILKKHFHIGNGQLAGPLSREVSAAITKIIDVIEKTQAGLQSKTLNISDVAGRDVTDPDPDERHPQGYVAEDDAGKPKGSIHIEFRHAFHKGKGRKERDRVKTLGFSKRALALVIVHEATHRFADTKDHAYADDGAYNTLTVAKAIDNADSYAFAILSLYESRVVTHRTLERGGEIF